MTVPTTPASSLDGLNPAQRAAASHEDGPVLIVAGPGSGKTRVIIHRIAYLVRERRVPPWNILAVTFTNKAAREMRDRAERLLGEDARSLHLGTFHAMCARWLRIDGAAVGVDPAFVIYDDADQLAVIKRILDDMSVDPRQFPPRALLSAISRAKSELIGPAEFSPGDYFEEIVDRVYPRYQASLQNAGALDFDDLLVRAVHLFRDHENVREKYAGRYRQVMVDEFQDTNISQYELARLLASVHGNICVVGDPDQSIYSWRSADIRNILHFERDFPGTAVYLLEQNYRSTQAILDAASAVISKNPERRERSLFTESTGGDRVLTHVVPTDEDEAEFVAREVGRLHARGEPHGSIAVMYRTNALSRPIEEAMVRYRTPYRIVGGVRFYQRREVKDLLAYLRLVHNRLDEASLLRVVNVPARGVGDRTMEVLRNAASEEGCALWDVAEGAAKGLRSDISLAGKPLAGLRGFVHLIDTLREERGQPLAKLLDRLLDLSGYARFLRDSGPDAEDRLENVLQLRSVLTQYEETGAAEGDLGAFLTDAALVADVDELDQRSDAVTLITLHAAKGLEFPTVFMIGMEEGVLPHARSFDDPAQMEEERRLAYVGMTRAEKRLYLTRAARRYQGAWSGPIGNPQSRFVKDLPGNVTEPWGNVAVPRTARPRPAETPFRPAAASFTAGAHVSHARFGPGTVVSTRERGGDVELTVAFESAGLKRLLQSMAGLTAAP